MKVHGIRALQLLLAMGLVAHFGTAAATIATIDINSSKNTIFASDGLSSSNAFFVTGIPFSNTSGATSPSGIASSTTTMNVSSTANSIIIDIMVSAGMAGFGGAADNRGSVTFNSPLPSLYWTVRGSYATSFDVQGSSFYEIGIGSFFGTDSVAAGTGTVFGFDLAGGQESVSGFSYRFDTGAAGGNTSGSGVVNLQVILSSDPIPPATVPIPAAICLFAPALLGLMRLARRG